MLMELSDHISSFTRQTTRTIQSVLSESKLEKIEIGRLIDKISSFAGPSDYIPSLVSNMNIMQRQPIVDLFRDMDLRIKTNYDISQSLAMLKYSMSTIFSGEIQKIEKDILYLESYINNWSFLSGEDDLYNYNFVENFNNTLNSNLFDSNQFQYPDRTGVPFSAIENAIVDPMTGSLQFSSGQSETTIDNFKDNIKEIKYYTNFSSEYISSSTNIENIFDNFSNKTWNLTIKSPFRIKESIFDRADFRQYRKPSQFDDSAQVAVEIILNNEINVSKININPNVTKGLYLMQAAVDSGPSNNPNPLAQNSSQKNIILDKPVYIDKSFDLTLSGNTLIKSIMLFFAQKEYVRTKITPIQSEANAKMINEFAKQIRQDRKKRHDTLQDMVIKFFIKDYAKDYILKNKRLYDYDYTYYYPTDLSKKSVGVLKQIKNNQYYSDLDSYNKFKNTTILSNLIFSIVSYSIGANIRASVKNTYIESNLRDLNKPMSTFASGGIAPLADSNNVSKNIHFIEESFSSIDKTNVVDVLNNIEIQNQYEYMFSLKNITIFENTTSVAVIPRRSVYVSKRISVPGTPLNVKMMANYFSELSRTDSSTTLNQTSAEFSVSIKDNPILENDWIPIMPFNDSTIKTEILFPNLKGEAALRFVPNLESINLYEFGVRRDPHTFIVNGKNITILNYKSVLDAYTVSYVPNNEKACKEISLFSRSLANPILTAASTNGFNGEIFEKTDFGNRVQLLHNPHVDYGKFANARYSPINGTITTSNSSFGNFDYSSYSPVKVVLDDGSVAINLTNYILDSSKKESFYKTDLLLFTHNGQSLLFNKSIDLPFRVLYHHIAEIFRYRVVLRNLDSSLSNYSIDRLLFKFSIESQDSIANTFIKYDNKYKTQIE